MKDRANKNLIKALAILFWIGVWHVVARTVNLELLVPAPWTTIVVLGELITKTSFWVSILYSIMRILSGFLLAVLTGSVLAMVTKFVPYTNQLFYPIMSVIKATPVASFIILLILWAQSTFVPVIATFLMVLPVVWSNVMTGLNSADEKLLEMAKVFKFGTIKTFRLIYWPACSQYFYTACVMGVGFAWKSGIAAEVISTPKFAIGTRLYESKIYLETAELFSWTLVIIILSIAVEKVFKDLIKRLSDRGAIDR